MQFIIVSCRRVGSTALALMLDSVSNVWCENEMVYVQGNHPRLRDKHIAINHAADVQQYFSAARTVTRGCKLTIPDYQADRIHAICALLKASGTPVVHLIRGLLEQYVSLQNAKYHNVWHQASGHVPLWIDAQKTVERQVTRTITATHDEINDIEMFCQRVIEIDSALTELRHSQPYLQLDHTALNHAETLIKLTEFLGLDEVVKPTNSLIRTTLNHEHYFLQQPKTLEIFTKYERIHKQSLANNK